jgi:predicted MPP superfamily phosphohydrolase
MTRRDFLKLSVRTAALATLAAGVGVGYTSQIEPGWLSVERVRLLLPRLPGAFDGYRLVQFSDIHMGGWMTEERLAEVIRLVNEQQPDLIAVTGDFLDHLPETYADALTGLLRRLAAKDGVVGIMGNHDYWCDPLGKATVSRQVLRDSGITDVSNGVHTLERGGALLHVAGLDDVWERKHRLDDVLDILPREGGAIMLAHEPDIADEVAAAGRFDLQISGHSHGGQVVVPFVGPLRLPLYGQKYPLGHYRVGPKEMHLYTTRGIGMIQPYVRFNCRPEITVYTFAAGG